MKRKKTKTKCRIKWLIYEDKYQLRPIADEPLTRERGPAKHCVSNIAMMMTTSSQLRASFIHKLRFQATAELRQTGS